MLPLLALACACLLLAVFTFSHALPPLSLSARLAAPGGTSPCLPHEHINHPLRATPVAQPAPAPV